MAVIPAEYLNDVASRFFLDTPKSELEDPITVCSLIEIAHWFYLDELVEGNEALHNIKYDAFAQQFLEHVGHVPVQGSIAEMLQEFRNFKYHVPTYGGLLLSDDLSHLLLVQSFHHKGNWGLPKGKINVDEELHKCAIREVMEETGYDISSLIDPEVYIERTVGEQFVRLYVIPGVPRNAVFGPMTKGEIRDIQWFAVSELPTHKNDRNFNKAKFASHSFYMVMPFMKPLREWIAAESRFRPQQKAQGGSRSPTKRETRRRHKSTGGEGSADARNRQRQTQQAVADYTTRHPMNVSMSTQLYYEKQDQMHSYDRFLGSIVCPHKVTPAKISTKATKISESTDHQKFSFKSRTKGHDGTFTSNVTNVGSTSGVKFTFSASAWEYFELDKRAINEALDRVWANTEIAYNQ